MTNDVKTIYFPPKIYDNIRGIGLSLLKEHIPDYKKNKKYKAGDLVKHDFMDDKIGSMDFIIYQADRDTSSPLASDDWVRVSYRNRTIYGGRGSGKTHSISKSICYVAKMLDYFGITGTIVCGREYYKSLKQSSLSEIKDAISSDPGLGAVFDVGQNFVRTKSGRIDFHFLGTRINTDSIKSISKILIFWLDEAEPVTDEAFYKIDPTVRLAGSEIIVTFNPENQDSYCWKYLVKKPDSDSIVTKINWSDNPWFNDTALNKIRVRDQKRLPREIYNWMWEGELLESSIGGIYNADDFGSYDSNLPKFKRIVKVGDTAETEEDIKESEKNKQNSAYTVFTLFGETDDGIYVLDHYRERVDYDNLTAAFIAFDSKHKSPAYLSQPAPDYDFYIEKKSSGKFLYQQMSKRGYNIEPIERHSGSGKKWERSIDSVVLLRGDIDKTTQEYKNRMKIMLPLEATKYCADVSWAREYKKNILSCKIKSDSGYWDEMDVQTDAIRILKEDDSSSFFSSLKKSNHARKGFGVR